ncbi:MAG: four helix bundle protein [Flammeovirgaceae bacterium]
MITDYKFQFTDLRLKIIVAKINSFEDLEVWQKAREFSLAIHKVTSEGALTKDYSLKDQINRSSGSIMDNIAEGFERGGKKEFIQFLFVAKGSCGETRSQLYRALDKKYITQEEFEELKSIALNISKQLAGFISYLKSSEIKGQKYVNEPEMFYGTYNL